RGKVSVGNQTGLLSEQRFETTLLEAITHRGGAAVLPHNGIANRPAGAAVPDDGGFALVGNADGGDITRSQLRIRECLRRHARLRRPDFIRIVLDPAGLWEKLREFLLGDGDDISAVIEYDRARTGCALIESKNVLH